VARGPDRDYRLRRQRQVAYVPLTGHPAGNPPVHLDGLCYDQDGKPLDKEQFAALQRDLVTAPRWIIDDNYASSLPIRLQAADTVIFLDLPAWTCLWGIARRRLRHRGGQH
jgi:adenylate kinase family enzyme